MSFFGSILSAINRIKCFLGFHSFLAKNIEIVSLPDSLRTNREESVYQELVCTRCEIEILAENSEYSSDWNYYTFANTLRVPYKGSAPGRFVPENCFDILFFGFLSVVAISAVIIVPILSLFS